MKVGDTDKTTGGRKFLNTWMVPRMANILATGDEVLFVGTDTTWDYKPFFWNPNKQMPYSTLDKSTQYKADIYANIERCPEVPDSKFSLILLIGVYEFLDHIPEAFAEMKRILKPGGYLLVAFPGKGYYPDNRGVSPLQVYDILKDFVVLETYNIYEGKQEPNSVIVLAQKGV